MRSLNKVLLVALGATVAGACGNRVQFDTSASGSAGTGSSGAGGSHTGSAGSAEGGGSTSSGVAHGGSSSVGSAHGGSSGVGSAHGGSSSVGSAQVGSSSSASSGGCPLGDEHVDMDGDGWAPADGDCNDCDPSVNPGAIDVAGDGLQVDHDCNGKYDPPSPCDGLLMLTSVDALDAARVLELCQVTTANPPLPQRTWGVVGAQYVRADGTAFAAPGLQVGLQSGFGSAVHPQGGQNMLVLSSGAARTPAQAGACGSASCSEDGPGTPPVGFPQTSPSCPPTASIADDVGLELALRVPTNATGYVFSFKFYTMEFPYWVCGGFADQFVALATPAPAGAINGNITFDSTTTPVSSTFSFINACDPTQIGTYAGSCQGTSASCPTAPTPYCSGGIGDLQGTGFDVWNTTDNGTAGATPWLTSQAPVVGGADLTLRFAIWDGGNQDFDSTILLDDFQWTTTPSVVVSTTVIAAPQ